MGKNTTDVTIYDVQTIENIRLIDSIVSQLNILNNLISFRASLKQNLFYLKIQRKS